MLRISFEVVIKSSVSTAALIDSIQKAENFFCIEPLEIDGSSIKDHFW
jgi:hypothetical protein